MSNYSDSSLDEENTNSSWYKVLQCIPEKATVLDIGCSSGNFGAELITRKQCVVDGIEVFPDDAELARKKLRDVYVLDIERDDLSAVTRKYDVIYFGDVIEHLVTPGKSLARVKRFLKPGGKIVFSIPNMAHATVRLLLLKGDFDYTETGLLDKTHLHFYTLEEVQRTFSEAGMHVQRLDFVEKDYPNELIESYLKPLGLKGSKQFYDLMRQPDAAAFQFVGEAVVAAKTVKPLKREQFGPIDLFEPYFTNTVTPLRTRITELETDLHKFMDRNAVLESQVAALEQQNLEMASHPYRHAGRTIKRKITKA